MSLWSPFLADASRSTQRQAATYCAMTLAIVGLDSVRPFGINCTVLYFLPLCYFGWIIRGELSSRLFLATAVVAILAPATLNFSYDVDGSRLFNRLVDIAVGLTLFVVLYRARRLADGLEAANQNLESRAAERTLELQRTNDELAAEIAERRQAQLQERETKQQLLQSQKLEVLGQFAGGIAHDFNNMLTVILGHTDMVLDVNLSALDQRKSLLAIKHAGERAAGLTHQLLVFSKHRVMRSKVVMLNDLIRETQTLLRPLISESIEIIVDLASDLPEVEIDPTQFSQLLINLAVNARDAMPKGGQLTIRTSLRPDHILPLDHEAAKSFQQSVVMEVSDTGCGIAPEIRERIFEPFFSTKTQVKRMGLGLSIVAEIVRQHHGTIEVSSTPRQGTRFRLCFPSSTRPASSHEIELPVQETVHGGTILLVEDEDPMRKLAMTVLTSSGYRVIEACQGTEACQQVSQLAEKIDLLLTDVVMPGMNGRELSDHLQVLLPDLRVIYMSGYHDDEIMALGVKHETVHFLAKPFTPSELTRKVQQVLAMETPAMPSPQNTPALRSAEAA